MDSDPEPAPRFIREAGVTGASAELCDAIVEGAKPLVVAGGVAVGVVVAESVSMAERFSFDTGLIGAGDWMTWRG